MLSLIEHTPRFKKGDRGAGMDGPLFPIHHGHNSDEQKTYPGRSKLYPPVN